jgi:alpha-methylacyl-CoA racemase
MSGGPLSGVRVLDLTRLLPGPVATLHLADLGADVIKIEDHGAGDYARILGDGPDGVSVFYRSVNRNKRGLRLDLKHPQGRAVFLRLAQAADIVVESFRPGVSDKLGIGYQALSAVNPRIVYCAITGYGQTGPLAMAAGHDLNYIGFAGVLDQIGVAGGQPAIPNLQVGDLLGGAMTAVMGILAALFDAQRSGRGRLVDVAMSEAVLAHNLFPFFALQTEGVGAAARCRSVERVVTPVMESMRPPTGATWRSHRWKRKFWDLFCDALARPEWKSKHALRGAAAAALRRELEALFASRNQAEWQDFFTGVDCCVTPDTQRCRGSRTPAVRCPRGWPCRRTE